MTFNEASTTVRNALRSLDESDRLRIAEAIWEEVEGDHATSSIELTDEQKAELDRRIADDDAHPDDAIPWEVVEAAARARMRR